MSNPVYFCHQCNRQVRSRESDLKCSDCGGEFIEEVGNSPFHLQFGGNAANTPPQPRMPTNPFGRGRDRRPHQQQPPVPPSNPLGAIAQFMNALTPQRTQATNTQPRTTRTRSFNEASGNQNRTEQDTMRMFLERFMGSLGNDPIRVQLNFTGDGPGGQGTHTFIGNLPGGLAELEQLQLDQIVTNLLNSFEAHQPSLGLPADVIARIPRIQVTQKHVDNDTQCTTCMETFHKDESVLELNCRHIFHNDCLIPWFDRHRTCPICRQEVDPAAFPEAPAQTPQPTANPSHLSDMDLD